MPNKTIKGQTNGLNYQSNKLTKADLNARKNKTTKTTKQTLMQ